MSEMDQLFAELRALPEFFCGQAANRTDIARIEGAMGMELDRGYIAFLRTFGFACWFPDSIFGVFERNEKELPGYDFDAVRRTQDAKAERVLDGFAGIPDGALIIGDDSSGGYYILLSANGGDRGRVIWWNYESGVSGGKMWPHFESYLRWLINKAQEC